MGRQFADDAMTPEAISVSRNKYKDELPADRPMHDNATPEHSNALYGGNQYAPAIQSGTPVSDLGQSPSKSTMDMNVTTARRGSES